MCNARNITDFSYDCTLRLFDSRNPKTPLLQIEVGGGVWRTKFHPDPSRRAILLATMHDGFKVVELSERLARSEWEELREQDAQITTRFDGHDSLAYGVDWCRLPPKDGKSLVVSCSFYDHAMHLWRE
jgi:diphthamide biosynthesis protein 7